MASARRVLIRVALVAAACYLLLGLLYACASLYCYNVRNWDANGGFSIPPLWPIFDPLFWPWMLRADWLHRVGVFRCLP